MLHHIESFGRVKPGNARVELNLCADNEPTVEPIYQG